MLQALLFDMDGLIFDTEGEYKKSWQFAAKEQGLDLTDNFYQRFIGTQDPDCEVMLCEHFGEQLDIERYRTVRDEHFAVQKAKGFAFMPGFAELFKAAKEQELTCAIVTSSALDSVQHHFKDTDYLKNFAALITAEDVTNGKPAPDCYLQACDKLGIKPEQAMVLEDSNNGMKAGLDAGCTAVMIPDLLPANEEIAKRAHHIVDSLHDVIPLIK